MGEKMYNSEINERITVYLRERAGFIEEAIDYHVDWDDDDELALRFGNATWKPDRSGMVFAFHCSEQLDPKAPPVTEWIAETLADVKAALPKVFDTISEIEIYCRRSHGFLKVL